MRALTLLPTILLLSACGETEAPKNSGFVPPAVAPAADPEPGCYADTASGFMMKLDESAPGTIRGMLRIALQEKDARNGDISGVRGEDGVIRAVYRFMQEGITDSVQLQFRQAAAQPLELRPSAYDPATGREYPDTSVDFSRNGIRLQRVACAGL